MVWREDEAPLTEEEQADAWATVHQGMFTSPTEP